MVLNKLPEVHTNMKQSQKFPLLGALHVKQSQEFPPLCALQHTTKEIFKPTANRTGGKVILCSFTTLSRINDQEIQRAYARSTDLQNVGRKLYGDHRMKSIMYSSYYV